MYRIAQCTTRRSRRRRSTIGGRFLFELRALTIDIQFQSVFSALSNTLLLYSCNCHKISPHRLLAHGHRISACSTFTGCANIYPTSMERATLRTWVYECGLRRVRRHTFICVVDARAGPKR